MKTNLELRAKLVKKYGEEEVRKVETDDFYMGTIPFEEYANIEIADTEYEKKIEDWSEKSTEEANIWRECMQTLKVMKSKTTGWHGANYERLHCLCEDNGLSIEQMREIIKNHKA